MTDEQEEMMIEAFALLDFKRYIEKNYISDALWDLATMTDNPIKREQLEKLSFMAFDLEEESE